MKKIVYEVDDFSQFDGEFHRLSKGLKMIFSDKLVIKEYSLRPEYITFEDRDNRFFNELYAYKILNERKCPFIAKLIDYSEDKKIIRLERISGMSIKEALDKKINIDIYETINKIKIMDKWFNDNKVYGINSHNIKDLVFNQDLSKLYLLDFEQFNIRSYKNYFFLDIIDDYLDRILRIKNIKIKYHLKSIKFFFKLLGLNYSSLFIYLYRLPKKMI